MKRGFIVLLALLVMCSIGAYAVETSRPAYETETEALLSRLGDGTYDGRPFEANYDWCSIIERYRVDSVSEEYFDSMYEPVEDAIQGLGFDYGDGHVWDLYYVWSRCHAWLEGTFDVPDEYIIYDWCCVYVSDDDKARFPEIAQIDTAMRAEGVKHVSEGHAAMAFVDKHLATMQARVDAGEFERSYMDYLALPEQVVDEAFEEYAESCDGYENAFPDGEDNTVRQYAVGYVGYNLHGGPSHLYGFDPGFDEGSEEYERIHYLLVEIINIVGNMGDWSFDNCISNLNYIFEDISQYMSPDEFRAMSVPDLDVAVGMLIDFDTWLPGVNAVLDGMSLEGYEGLPFKFYADTEFLPSCPYGEYLMDYVFKPYVHEVSGSDVLKHELEDTLAGLSEQERQDILDFAKYGYGFLRTDLSASDHYVCLRKLLALPVFPLDGELYDLVANLFDAGYDPDEYSSSPVSLSVEWQELQGLVPDGTDKSVAMLDFTGRCDSYVDSGVYVTLNVDFSVDREVARGELALSVPYRLSDVMGSLVEENDYPYMDKAIFESIAETIQGFETMSGDTCLSGTFEPSGYGTIVNSESLMPGHYGFDIRYHVPVYFVSKLPYDFFQGGVGVDYGSFSDIRPFSLTLLTDVQSARIRSYEGRSSGTGLSDTVEDNHRRIYSWLSVLEDAYGLSEEEFNSAGDSIFVEFVFRPEIATSRNLRRMGMRIDASGGTIIGATTFQRRNCMVDGDTGTVWVDAFGYNNPSYYMGFDQCGPWYTTDSQDYYADCYVHVLVRFPVDRDAVMAGDGIVRTGITVDAVAEDFRGNSYDFDLNYKLEHSSLLGRIDSDGSLHSLSTRTYGLGAVSALALQHGVSFSIDPDVYANTSFYHDFDGSFYTVSVLNDLVLALDGGGNLVRLEDGDYSFSDMYVNLDMGIAEMNGSSDLDGSFLGWKRKLQADELPCTELEVWAMVDGEWVLDGTIPYERFGRSFYKTSSSGSSRVRYVFNNSGVCRYKVTCKSAYGYFKFYVTAGKMTFLPSARMVGLVNNNRQVNLYTYPGWICQAPDGAMHNAVGEDWFTGLGKSAVQVFDRETYGDVLGEGQHVYRGITNLRTLESTEFSANLQSDLGIFYNTEKYFVRDGAGNWRGQTQESGWVPSTVSYSLVSSVSCQGADLESYDAFLETLDDDSLFTCEDVRFYVLVPGTLDVKSVTSGLSQMCISFNKLMPDSRDEYGWVTYDSPYELRYTAEENYNGSPFTLVTVDCHSDTGPILSEFRQYRRGALRVGSIMGGIRVNCMPKADYIKQGDYDFYAVAEFLDADGNAIDLSGFSGGGDTCKDDGYWSGGPQDDYRGLFKDINANGTMDVLEFVGSRMNMEILSQPGRTNMTLRTTGDNVPAWAQTDTLTWGTPYRYRLGYGATQDRSTDVVLFMDIESDSDVKGVLKGIDTSYLEYKGLPYRIFASGKYAGKNPVLRESDLEASPDWAEVGDGFDFSSTRSIAVSFGDHVFGTESEMSGQYEDNFVYVYLDMELPDDARGNTITCAASYADRLVVASDTARRAAPSNTVKLNLSTDVKPVLHKTIGLGSVVPGEHTHDYNTPSEILVEPTCVKDGKAVMRCSCGDTVTMDLPASEAYHTWGPWRVDEATGKKTRTCSFGEHVEEYVDDMSVTARFDANGGTFGDELVIVEKFDKGTYFWLWDIQPYRDGYRFCGWTLDGELVVDSVTMEEDMTFLARWEQETVTLTYDANGGMNPPAPSIVPLGDDVTVRNDRGMTRDGHAFLGWSLDRFASSATVYPGSTFVLGEDTTLYAVWEKIEDNGRGVSWSIVRVSINDDSLATVAAPGDEIVWNIMLTNESNLTKNVSVLETLQGACVDTANSDTISLFLAPGESEILVVRYTVKRADAGLKLYNTFRVIVGTDFVEECTDTGTDVLAKSRSAMLSCSIANSNSYDKSSLDGQVLTIDRDGYVIGDEFKYHYCLSYRAQSGTTRGLAIGDLIEDGTDSIYAGRLESVMVDVESLVSDQLDERLTGYVYMRGGTGDDGLSGTPMESLGGTDWEKIGEFTTDYAGKAFVEITRDDVGEVAVYFPDAMFTKDEIVRVYFNIDHGTRAGQSGDARELRNHVKASYGIQGSDAPIGVTSKDETVVKVVYPEPVEMPETGGSGTVGYTALGVALVSTGLYVSRRKRRNK